MAAYLRPRRGNVANSTIVLREGEVYLDTSNNSKATSTPGWGRLFIGDGETQLKNLKPFISLPEEMIINSGISSSGSITDIDNGKSLSTIFSAIKNEIESYNSEYEHITGLHSFEADIYKFGQICQFVLYIPDVLLEVAPREKVKILSIDEPSFRPVVSNVYFCTESLFRGENETGTAGSLSLYIDSNGDVYVENTVRNSNFKCTIRKTYFAFTYISNE